MVKLSNGHVLNHVIQSGALAWDGKGWPHERPLYWLGFIKPELFTVTTKSLTLHPRKGNLRWWKPWSCVRTIKGGTVNKVGLTNKGFDWWCKKVGPTLDSKKIPIIVSLFGNEAELLEMVRRLVEYNFDIIGIEINYSCPNTGHGFDEVAAIVSTVKAIKAICPYPIILKLSAKQNCVEIARQLVGYAEAISFNSVPYEMVFPKNRSPLWRLEKKVGGGGGGVSGIPAQKHNWGAMTEIIWYVPNMPVIAASVMSLADVQHVRALGAHAVAYGAIHLPDHPVWRKPWTIFTNPCKPTRIVKIMIARKDFVHA